MPAPQEQKPSSSQPPNLSSNLLQKLIVFNFIWSILGIFADWTWLSSIPFYLIPFTVICSLYPPLLLIIYIFIKQGKNPPQALLWFTSIGLISYGLMAQLYFPLLMSWKGFNLHDFGSMFWVAAYGLQFFLIRKYLRPLPLTQLTLVMAYFIAINSTHYFYPTFVDFNIYNYPNWLKYTTAIGTISLQIFAILLTWKVAHKNSHRASN
jgi:hypothetical protein